MLKPRVILHLTGSGGPLPMNVDTVLFYLNWLIASLQDVQVVAFEPAMLLGLWGLLGLFLEGKRIKFQIPVWTFTVGLCFSAVWMFCVWNFYLHAIPNPEAGDVANLITMMIGAAVFSFVTPFVVGLAFAMPFFVLPMLIITTIKDPSIFFGGR